MQEQDAGRRTQTQVRRTQDAVRMGVAKRGTGLQAAGGRSGRHTDRGTAQVQGRSKEGA